MPLEIHMVHVQEDDPDQYLVLATFLVRMHGALCPVPCMYACMHACFDWLVR
jgi:hypothetical protein